MIMIISKGTVLGLFLPFSFPCIALGHPTNEEQPSYMQTIEPSLKQAFRDAWKGTIIGDSLLLLSKQCRHAFFGHHDVDESVMDFINPMICNAELDNAVTIKKSNRFWSLFGSRIFSNHDSIFITEQLCKQISSGTVPKQIKEQVYKELARTLALIKHKWDKKILTASIIIPPLIFLGARGINMLMQRYSKDAQEHSWIKKIAYATKCYTNSFWYKTGTVLILMLGYALYLNRHISDDTITLLKQLGYNTSPNSHSWWTLTNPLSPLLSLLL